MNVHSAQTAYSIAPAETAQIAVAYGDGIGPEIIARPPCDACTPQALTWTFMRSFLGEKVYEAGHTSGILPDSWEHIAVRRCPVQRPDHHATGRRLQIAERDNQKDARALRQHPPLRCAHTLCGIKSSGDGCRDLPGKRGRPLRRD